MSVEIEQKYIISISLDELKATLENQGINVTEQKLIDIRYNRTTNAGGGMDFERIRTSTVNGLTTTFHTRKFTDKNGVRQEIEAEIPLRLAYPEVSDKQVAYLRKTRYSSSQTVIFKDQPLELHYDIDVIDGSSTIFCEIEVIKETNLREQGLHVLFDQLMQKLDPLATPTEVSMLSLSQEIILNDEKYLL